MSSDGSSSDSDVESEGENEVKEQVKALEEALQNSPYYYDGYTQLITLLRRQGDLEKAREARNGMRKVYPLSEELWLEWINDEIPLTGLFPESVLELRMLFESAVEDYLSVNIWLTYSQFAVDKMSVLPGGVAFPREVFERAVVACGLHVGQSGKIWDAYLAFEMALLRSLQDMQLESSDDAELRSQVEAQFERVDKLFKRRLSTAHIGMEEAFREYQATFTELAISEEKLPAYVMAKKKLEEYLPFERKLASSDPPSLESYRDYLAHLKKVKGDPSLMNTLYQRAISHHCLDPQLWQNYLTFLDSNFKSAEAVLLPGYRQAVRNCPWNSKFWLGLVRGLERTGASHEEIVATFERALGDNFQSSSDYLAVWTAYCDYHRRRASAKEGEDPAPGNAHRELLDLFTRAKAKLMEDFGKQGDTKDALSRYHANMEKGVSEGRGIWEDIMTRHGKEAEYWMDYITYVRQREGGESCRKLFRQAVNSVTDAPERVCEAYVQFEREEGSLETFETALSRTQAQMDRIKERQEKAAEKEAHAKEDLKKKRKLDKKSQKKGKQPQEPGDVSGSQRSAGKRSRAAAHVFFKDSDEEEEGGRERKKPKVCDGEEDSGTRLPTSTTTTQPVPEGGGVTTPVAMETDGPAAGQGKGEGPKEKRTVFVSNLTPEVTDTKLKEKFSECGEVLEVRIVHSRGRSNRTNTFAYVEFVSPTSVSSALSLDRSLFMDRNVYVSPFREKGEQPMAASKHSERMNKMTVFVKNLQKDIGEERLQDLFKQCGEVKEVRIVKNLQGRSKGFAYVEFTKESSAVEAVEKLNSHLLGLKRIQVAISNPPGAKRDSEGAAAPRPTSGGVAGSGDKDGFAIPTLVPPHRAMLPQDGDALVGSKRKATVSLMPRVLAKKSGSEEVKKQAPRPVTKMSNDDFRKLFSKQ